MSKNVRFAIYTAILVVCFVSDILAIYDAVFLKEDKQKPVIIPAANNQAGSAENPEEPTETMEVRVANFKTLFTNQIYKGDYDISKIEKSDPAKDIVYTAAELQETKDLYEINLKIPLININHEITQRMNQNTQEIFADRANKILQGTTEKTIFDVEYVAYINGDILSLVIMSTLKEGNQAQRVIVQTYNYNLKNKTEVTAEEMLTSLHYDIDTVNDEIKREIKQVSDEAAALQQSGYEGYTRNPEDARYLVKNAKTYFMGENGAVYLIYAYGNNDVTSEMDIIRFD